MVSSKYCCPACFGDIDLEQQIFPSLNAKLGDCDFCQSKDVLTLKPEQLVESFLPLVEVYKPSDKGKKLVEYLREDWKLFENPSLNPQNALELIDTILGDKKLAQSICTPDDRFKSEGISRWEAFKNEIMHENRWFLNKGINLDLLEEHLSLLIAEKPPMNWFRARLIKGNKDFTLSDMGPPPKKLSTSGRANPAGIPYLYLASDPATAFAEVRPHNKESACIAGYSICETRIIDLRDPRRRVSPFILQDPDKIGTLLAELPFLERLGSELSRPVLPFEAVINYTPSQYLCEFIKLKNYDGVIFKSSVGTGFNLALFDSSKAKARNIEKRIAEVSVQIL